jgi:hypothetical protein
MKNLKDSNDTIKLVELENGAIGFVARIAPLVKEKHFWFADKKQAISIFYPAEMVNAGECTNTEIEIFGHEAQCENETHYFPSFEALGENRIVLSCEDAYLFSKCDHRQNNPVIGVYTKEAPHPDAYVYAIKKGTEFIALSPMTDAKYVLI